MALVMLALLLLLENIHGGGPHGLLKKKYKGDNMTVKTITKPDGKTVKFGRKRPLPRLTLSLKKYLLGIPSSPSTIEYSDEAVAALSQMYMNDTLGDCVIACCEHVDGVWTGNASNGSPVIYTDTQTEQFYGACGYVPGNSSTDQGCDIQTTFSWWQQNGIPGGDATNKPVGWLAVDPTNQAEIQAALYVFENLVFGMELPDAWITPFPSASGFVWDVAGPADPNNGHCVAGIGYNSQGVQISTWGMIGTITWAAIAQYCSASVQGELYTLLDQDQLNVATQLAPQAEGGLNWSQLVADFNSMGGNVPVPAPNPTPVPPPPTPAPPPPPVPTTEGPFSVAWMQENLSTKAFLQALRALEEVARHGIRLDNSRSIPMSAAWWKANLSSDAFIQAVIAMENLNTPGLSLRYMVV